MCSKENYLALCLYEALEDKNLSSLIVLIERHGANPNTIIPDRQIAPIHFCVGFENSEFAEEATKFLLNKGANPNVPSEDETRLTPLHIACIWGRPTIVKLLLEHGGDLKLKCSENKTPILYAIHENHYTVIEVIKKFIFELKIEHKKNELLLKIKSCNSPISLASPRKLLLESPSTPIKSSNGLRSTVQAIQNLDEKKFTPNRINYNFDATSPYYINIAHRRHKSSKCINNSQDLNNTNDDDSKPIKSCQKNLFELTEKNLKDFSKQMTSVIVQNRLAIHKRRSYISAWREKLQLIRKTDNETDINYMNFLNNYNDITQMNKTHEYQHGTSSSESSFVSAISKLDQIEKPVNVELKEKPMLEKLNSEYLVHLTEDYIHSDNENGLVFYEKKILSRSHENLRKLKEDSDNDDTESQSSAATKITLPPLDYDTDALRTELVNFGHAPGPITKSTKKLYLKQLVKCKRDPEKMDFQSQKKNSAQIFFSVELQRTVNNIGYMDDKIIDFMKLEANMVDYFLQKTNIRWREGNLKTSFIYLLIDPRISDNLPLVYKKLDRTDVWKRFLSSIFYVGKGKSSRPYSHLYDAIKLFSKENNQLATRLENKKNQVIEKCVLYSNSADNKENLKSSKSSKCKTNSQSCLKESTKLNKIIDIWKSGLGVVCLHTFHNIMPSEAYTREAAIIETLGLNNLTNMKKGDFYGIATSWQLRQRRYLGIALLYRAMNMYLAEGESQLLPFDLI